MGSLDRIVAWFQSHKAVLGSFFLGLATVVGGAGTVYANDSFVHAAALLALIGGTLAGAGAAKSDQFYREKLAVIQTKIDRRNGDSLIPVSDLQRLLADPADKDV